MSSERCLIIAEAGVNHNGDLELAKRLIDVAAEAKADAVKFQSFRAERLVTPRAPLAEYQRAGSGSAASQLEMLKKLELSRAAHETLLEYAREKKIEFLSTPFDEESLALLVELGLKTIKISSGELTNLPLLRRIGALPVRIILSTGMATMEEISRALTILTQAGAKLNDITLLQANSAYPTPFCDVNLRAMATLAEEFGVAVGYSDHTPGIEVALAAVALGAAVIEKHFTLDRTLPGPDHAASLLPGELTQMVAAIRNIEAALGSTQKEPTPSELKNHPVVRKSIVAAGAIKKGEEFTEKNITTLRPGDGISPLQWDALLGQRALRDFEVAEQIEWSEPSESGEE